MRLVDLPGGWTVGQLDLLGNLPTIRHAFSTCKGPHAGDLDSRCSQGTENRRSLAEALGVSGCAWARQVHGPVVADADDAREGMIEADALATARQGMALLGLSADCPIILACDAVRGAVGMAHASWRCTVQGIAGRLIEFMQSSYGCRSADMQAGIGPSAGPARYEVGQEVREAACASLGSSAGQFFITNQSRMYLDLWRANVEQLVQAGICRHNIAVAGVCTISDNLFYSYRRQGEQAGRCGGIIARV